MEKHVNISPSNSKMGPIPSVSLPSITTCRQCECQHKCYARKLERLRPNVRDAYQNNLDILNTDPVTYWREVEAHIMLSRFFRFHVSGDIPNAYYFAQMVRVATHNPHCNILCFTKQYEIVNEFVSFRKAILSSPLPHNLHIIFSAWPHLEMQNPHNFPTAHVLFKDGTTTARDDAFPCPGNCSECGITDSGCWTLQPGQQILFNEH